MHRRKMVPTLLLAVCLCIVDCERSDGVSTRDKDRLDSEPAAANLVSFWGAGSHAMADAGQDRPAELGIRFSSDIPAQLTAIRFYKFAGNSGPHVANIWSCDGVL